LIYGAKNAIIKVLRCIKKEKLDNKFLGSTTQSAPLEKFLAGRRLARLKNIYQGKQVLDFGCGLHGRAVAHMSKKAFIVHGVDPSIKKHLSGRNSLFSSLDDLQGQKYDLITAFAVFEHIPPFQLVDLLAAFHRMTSDNGLIFGTVPTPLSRPVLEFLSFKLKLIDSSQIKDHWVYYDDLWLQEIVALAGWRLARYKKFQFGLNSEFKLIKNDCADFS